MTIFSEFALLVYVLVLPLLVTNTCLKGLSGLQEALGEWSCSSWR